MEQEANKDTVQSDNTHDNNESVTSVAQKTESTPDEILLNLKIIGCIKKKDRISKNSDEILEIETNDWFQSMRRWWFGRSRNETINNIKKIIQTSFDITDRTLDQEKATNKQDTTFYSNTSNNLYFNEENSNLLQRFVIEMKNANKGLANLKITYSDDVRIVSEIDILLEQLALRIEKISSILRIDVSAVNKKNE